MLRLFFVGLLVLGLLYCAKVSLLHFAVPSEPADVVEGVDSGLPASASASDLSEATGPRGHPSIQASVAAYRQGDDAKAIAILQECIDNLELEENVGAACCTAMGEMHMVGAGVPRNLSKAKLLFQKAADVGDADAQFNLGILYGASAESGGDLKNQEAMAVLNLYAASTAGHTGALMAMGYRHMHGYGVPQACTTAAMNYIDVAKRIASIYSEGMPQAVELIRLNLHQKDRKVISSSEMNLFVQIAVSGDTTVAAAIGKRFLLGIEGLKQDYHKAKHYLRMAASRQHPAALALLGYMHCLGLGLPQNLDTAYSYFVSSAAQNDPLGHNGLGFIYFRGTPLQARSMKLAFKHFNESAFAGSSDGMFNLASMYLTGTGTEQSFQKAVMLYTQALDRGHTPAAYSLAVMHLNGIGTVRDCDIAVNLLKKVCERGEWVSSKLVEANDHGDKHPDKAALLYLKLAEAGQDVAQMNAAHLFDFGRSVLLLPEGSEVSAEEMRQSGRELAQRYYELSAEQGSASSELRLGDFAYYGWGVSADFREQGPDASTGAGQDEEALELPSMYGANEVELKPQPVDYESSIARYRKTAELTVTGEWMQSFVATASFNMAFMHQFGLGVPQDMHLAKQHYFRSREVDPSGLHTPVTLGLSFLAAHTIYLRLPHGEVLLERLLGDTRVHLLVGHFMGVVVLVVMRHVFSQPLRRVRPQTNTGEDATGTV